MSELNFIDFIKSMDDKQLKYTAFSDYGDQQDEYFRELKKVIFHQSCILYPEQQYMPGEVIDLCSNAYVAKHAKEYIACNLLLIINRGAFDSLDMARKLKKQEYDYGSLSETYHNLIVRAYKWAGFKRRAPLS
ncbi:hypothetical protein ACSV5M_00015 [Cellvibrio sp. ARAG 10.3]|uniref:hypothetical protein n=1 Tax=Cellvibrio sp. ARAG 10.3 TaxID=3451358 RepID=UPI003F44B3BD